MIKFCLLGLRTLGVACMGLLSSLAQNSMDGSEKESLGAPLMLPPFTVTEDTYTPWRYAKAEGIEVLSRCADEVTTELILQQLGLRALLETILPKQLQAATVVPDTFLFYSDGSGTLVDEDLLNSLRRSDNSRSHAVDNDVRAMTNFYFHDQDSLAAFFIWEEVNRDRGGLKLTPSYLRYMLENRTPTLPSWFVEGMLELYRTVTIANPPLRPMVAPYTRPGTTSIEQSLMLPVAAHPEIKPIMVGRAYWISQELTEFYKEHKSSNPSIMPLEVMFAEPPPTLAADERAMRRSQAALFIRSFLEEKNLAKRNALWKFVEVTSTQPVTEQVFRECIGTSYRIFEDELTTYFHRALQTPFTISPTHSRDQVQIQIHTASATEISRLKGRLNRLEIDYIRHVSPQLTEDYIEQARRTLRKSYTDGDRDPRLIAEMGIFECETGNDAIARPFLEAAIAAKVERPRAYYELARIRFNEIVAIETGPRFTPEQVNKVVEPLTTMTGLVPALEEAYDLMVKVWLFSEISPTAKQWTALEQGAVLFPRHSKLVFLIANLHAKHGQTVAAEKWITRGLNFTNDPQMRDKFEKLRGEPANF